MIFYRSQILNSFECHQYGYISNYLRIPNIPVKQHYYLHLLVIWYKEHYHLAADLRLLIKRGTITIPNQLGGEGTGEVGFNIAGDMEIGYSHVKAKKISGVILGHLNITSGKEALRYFDCK